MSLIGGRILLQDLDSSAALAPHVNPLGYESQDSPDFDDDFDEDFDDGFDDDGPDLDITPPNRMLATAASGRHSPSLTELSTRKPSDSNISFYNTDASSYFSDDIDLKIAPPARSLCYTYVCEA